MHAAEAARLPAAGRLRYCRSSGGGCSAQTSFANYNARTRTVQASGPGIGGRRGRCGRGKGVRLPGQLIDGHHITGRSEEHTSELPSHSDIVCRLFLLKKKKKIKTTSNVMRYSEELILD